jgi:hypothetical protein
VLGDFPAAMGLAYSWAWAARPGPKIPGLDGSGLHFGPGLGLKYEPERRAGPSSGLHFCAFFPGRAGPGFFLVRDGFRLKLQAQRLGLTFYPWAF